MRIEKFKRKKVGIQEKNSVLTLESLKQSTNYNINLILDYLEKLPDDIKAELKSKLDKTGGVIDGNLEIEGILANNTDEIVSNGNFNQGSWNYPKRGALTQIIDDTRAQHSVIVGRGKDGNRHYSIDLLDNYNTPEMRLYAGNHFLHIGLNNLEYDGKIVTTRKSFCSIRGTTSRGYIDMPTNWTNYRVTELTGTTAQYGDLWYSDGGIYVNRNMIVALNFDLVTLGSATGGSSEFDVSLLNQKGQTLIANNGQISDSLISHSKSPVCIQVYAGDTIYMGINSGLIGTQTIIPSTSNITAQEV